MRAPLKVGHTRKTVSCAVRSFREGLDRSKTVYTLGDGGRRGIQEDKYSKKRLWEREIGAHLRWSVQLGFDLAQGKGQERIVLGASLDSAHAGLFTPWCGLSIVRAISWIYYLFLFLWYWSSPAVLTEIGTPTPWMRLTARRVQRQHCNKAHRLWRQTRNLIPLV